MKKKPKFNQEMAMRGANRRLFARSPFVVEKLEESRQEFPRYKKDGTLAKKPWVKRQCEVCSNWVGSTKISIDHKDPVVPSEGFPANFDMWDRITIFLRRLWCDKSNLQRICDACHDSKTYAERIARLTAQYTKELDELDRQVNMSDNHRNLFGTSDAFKTMIKSLNKYIAKKKTIDLKEIVERAKKIKDRVQEYKKTYDKT